MSLLTTITPYWSRSDMLRKWVAALRGATHPRVCHFIFFIGEPLPSWWMAEIQGLPIVAIIREEAPKMSIGHYHNLGAESASSMWIMKLDVDALPNERYFKELIPLLERAKPREWFNGGMVYVNRSQSSSLCASGSPLSATRYEQIMENPRLHSESFYCLPAATNFICRRDDYLDLGGCDERFLGYGWEDYQQIYMLEKNQLGNDPLPGVISIDNVTRRCRDEISRRKAKELWERNRWLCLFHHSHPGAIKDPRGLGHNRKVLLDYIIQTRDHIL